MTWSKFDTEAPQILDATGRPATCDSCTSDVNNCWFRIFCFCVFVFQVTWWWRQQVLRKPEYNSPRLYSVTLQNKVAFICSSIVTVFLGPYRKHRLRFWRHSNTWSTISQRSDLVITSSFYMWLRYFESLHLFLYKSGSLTLIRREGDKLRVLKAGC
jgi:hypothetical protein